MVVGCSESINVGPLSIFLALSFFGSKQGESSQRPLRIWFCPIMTVTKTSALLRMELNCPSRKFQEKCGQFLQLSVVSSITMTLTAKILPLVSAFLEDNLYYTSSWLPHAPLCILSVFGDHHFAGRVWDHLSPSSLFSTFWSPVAGLGSEDLGKDKTNSPQCGWSQTGKAGWLCSFLKFSFYFS